MIIPVKKAQQLDGRTGQVQAEVVGEERIFSIPDTKKIVRLSLEAKSEAHLEALGRFVAGAIRRQDSRKPEMTKV